MDIYSELILDHYKNPHNKGHLKKTTVKVQVNNPLCGDRLTLELEIDSKNTIKKVKITPSGCAISTASASMLSDAIINKKISQIKKLKPQDIYKMLAISISPARTKCALLSLSALKEALTHTFPLAKTPKICYNKTNIKTKTNGKTKRRTG